MTKRDVILAASLFGLVLANLAIDVGLIWFVEESNRQWRAVHEVPIGILLGQLMLVGLWRGLGDGRWYLRIVVAIALTLAIAKTIGVAESLLTRRNGTDPGHEMVIAFILLPMMLTSAVLAFVLRRIRGWRMTWQSLPVGVSPGSQFQMSDALLWTTVIGGALASCRFMLTIDQTFTSQLRDLSIYTAKTTAVVIAAAVLAFAPKHQVRTAIWFTIIVALVGAVFAMPDVCNDVQRMRTTATLPAPFSEFAVAWGNQTLTHEAFAIAAALGTLANCLVLRALGCRLIRPSGRAADSLSSATADCV
jgi:hypothetical protein